MNANIAFLKKYIPHDELYVLLQQSHGEEGAFFEELLEQTEKLIKEVPPLYASEGLGKDAPAHLHYFGGATDIWITELDQETGDAFGYTCLNGDTDNAELGYVSVPEIVATNMLELDLYWEKTPLKEVMA